MTTNIGLACPICLQLSHRQPRRKAAMETDGACASRFCPGRCLHSMGATMVLGWVVLPHQAEQQPRKWAPTVPSQRPESLAMHRGDRRHSRKTSPEGAVAYRCGVSY